MDTVTPHGLLMLRTCFLDFAVEHWFGCRATEPGFAGDIGAIEIWLIDWLIDWIGAKDLVVFTCLVEIAKLRGFFCFGARYKSLQTIANVTHLLKEVLPFQFLSSIHYFFVVNLNTTSITCPTGWNIIFNLKHPLYVWLYVVPAALECLETTLPPPPKKKKPRITFGYMIWR